jgi:uncharacterized protein (TIRG00374 family)
MTKLSNASYFTIHTFSLQLHPMRKHLSTLLKVAISVAGLVYVFLKVPFSDLQAELVNIRWFWVAVVLALMLIGLAVRAFRWLLLLRGLGATIQFKRLLELYFVGAFFNTFLPSGFGGDVVRVLEVSQDVPSNIAAGTVIVDRLTGLLMLFVMALIALPFRPDNFPADLTIQIAVVSIIGLIGGFILLEGRLIRRYGRWLPGKLSVTDPDQPLAKLLQAVQGCGGQAIASALAVSVLFNLILCSWWLVAGLAFGYTVNFTHYLLVVPIFSILLLIPSIGGLGVRESMAPVLFGAALASDAQAFSLALLVTILTRVSGLLGGPVYIGSVLRNRHAKTAESLKSPHA